MVKPEKLGLSRLDGSADPDDYDWVIELPAPVAGAMDKDSMVAVLESWERVKDASQKMYEAILAHEEAIKELMT